MTEAENPYILVLDAVFPKIIPAKGYRDTDFRRMRKALDGLEVQLNIAATDGNYRGIFQIASAILSKSLPVLEKMEGNRREVMLHFCQLALDHIAAVSDAHLSIELRHSAWELIFDLGIQGLLPSTLQRSALQFLTGAAMDAEKQSLIETRFQHTPHPAPGFLLELYLVVLANKKIPEAAPMVLDDFVETPDVIRAAILQLYYLKHWDAVIKAGQHFLPKQIFSPKQQREIEDILLFVAEQKGDKSTQIELLQQRFMKSGNFEAFRKLKVVAGKNWLKLRKKMVEDLSARGEINFIAAALAADEQFEELAQLIENEGTMLMLQRYESYFYKTNPEFLRQQYVRLLSEYLDNHFGAPAAKQVRQRLTELHQNGQPELVLQVSKALLAKFQDRPSLPEELSDLLPKAKRKALFSNQNPSA